MTDKTIDNDSIPESQVNTNDLINHTEEVVIGSEQGVTFPTKVGATLCNALNDTSATRSCMSETYYRTLQLNSICSLSNTHVRSATGSNLSPLGIVNYTFELGKTVFINDFIVCQNLTRPFILGRDFLMKSRVTVRYSEDGKCILNCHQEELIATLDVINNPQLQTMTSVLLPGRTLAVIKVNSNLVPEQSGQIYEIKPNMMLSETYPNVYIVPMIHNVGTYITESVPMVLIHFSVDDISISKGEIKGFLTKSIFGYISEIRTETSTEPSPLILKEDNVMEVLQEYGEMKFITSPADIDVHQKVELQDAEVSEEHQKAFKSYVMSLKISFQ